MANNSLADIGFSKTAVSLQLSGEETGEEKVSFSEKIINLKMLAAAPEFVEVEINSEEHYVNLKALSVGQGSLTFNADNAFEAKTIAITVSEQKVAIVLSKTEVDLKVVDEVSGSETVTFNTAVKNLKLLTAVPDFLTVEINNTSKEIKVTGTKNGEVTLTFTSDNAPNNVELVVKCVETKTPTPVIGAVADQILYLKDPTKVIELEITNPVAGEQLNISALDGSIVKGSYDVVTKNLTLEALKEGITSITLSYKKAAAVTFKVQVYDVLDLSKLTNILGYIEGFSEKTTQTSLTETDKQILAKEVLKYNQITEANVSIYLADLEVSNFHEVQGQKINRRFNLTAKSNSNVVAGTLTDINLRVAPLDLADKENQIKNGGNFITSLTSENQNDKEQVAIAILSQFIQLNIDLNPVLLEDIKIKTGSAINYKNNVYTITIIAADNQNNTEGETEYTFSGFYVNSQITVIDIEALFN